MLTKLLRGVFYGEVVLNIVSGVIPFLAPAYFLAQFTTASVSPVVLEVTRWYGILLFDLVFLELWALLSRRDDFLTMLLGGYLMGDLIQLSVLYFFVKAGGITGFAFYLTIVVTVILVISRITWLIRAYRKPQPAVASAP